MACEGLRMILTDASLTAHWPEKMSRALPARIQHMIDVLLANQALICHYSNGHIELHFKDQQVTAVMKHSLLTGDGL